MTTMTIHVDDAFAVALRSFADKCGLSINQTVKNMLSPLLGLSADEGKASPYADLVGALSHDEADELRKAVAAQHVIDEEMWA
jgi:hypothetical protein